VSERDIRFRLEDGVATMQVIDAARESARSGRREPIGAAR